MSRGAPLKFELRNLQDSDFPRICELFAELQEAERQGEPLRLPGEVIADKYMSGLLQRMKDGKGRIVVAVQDDGPVGFVAVFLSELLDPELNEPLPVAYISDLVVSGLARRQGIGRALLAEAERLAAEAGAQALTLNVLASNMGARSVYSECGFSEYSLTLRKPV
jgi:ribosomal protein S18 acetylase RimI-like enzyme